MTETTHSTQSLPSDDVGFPDLFSETSKSSTKAGTVSKAPHVAAAAHSQEPLAKETSDFDDDNDSKAPMEPQNSASSDANHEKDSLHAWETSNSQATISNSLRSSLREHVRPGESKRTQFPLVPSKVALLVIDIQDYLSSPSNIQDEEEHAYFYQQALPRTVANVEKLLQQTRKQRDSQSQGCEVIFTYLEALTQDCRDVSLDYKLSGPQLATLPTSTTCPAKFLESVHPETRDGKGDIMIPKTSCSVFMSTNLHYVLQNLHIEQLLVCGQLTDQCVESAVRDAADLGYFVTLVEDACAAKSPDAHQKGLSGMKGFSRTLTTQQVLDELQNPPDKTIIVTSLANVAEPVEEKVGAPQRQVAEPSDHVSIIPAQKWKAPACNEDAATTALLHTMQFAGVKFLRYMAVDAFNSIRCKAVPLHGLAKSKRLGNHVSIAQVCFAGLPTDGDYMVDSTGLDARHVLTLQPDISSLRILPYAPTSAVVMGTAWDPTTNCVSPLCTRGLLSRVIDTARQHGIEFVSQSRVCFSFASCARLVANSSLSLSFFSMLEPRLNSVFTRKESQWISLCLPIRPP